MEFKQPTNVMLEISGDSWVGHHHIWLDSLLDLIEHGANGVSNALSYYEKQPLSLAKAKDDGWKMLAFLRNVGVDALTRRERKMPTAQEEEPEPSGYVSPSWYDKTCDTCKHAPSLPMYTPPPRSKRNPPIGIAKPIICIEPRSDHHGHLLMPFHEACIEYAELPTASPEGATSNTVNISGPFQIVLNPDYTGDIPQLLFDKTYYGLGKPLDKGRLFGILCSILDRDRDATTTEKD